MELFTNLFSICGAVSAAALTASIVKAAWDYLRGKTFLPRQPQSQPQIIWNPGTTTSGPSGASGAATVSYARLEPAPTSEPMPPAHLERVTGAPTPPGAFSSARRPLPGDLILECGRCGKQIKSQPLTAKAVGEKTELRYRCENCGAVVAVKT